MKLVLITIMSMLLASCSSSGSIKLTSTSIPPAFEISGGEAVQWIWFQGPYQNRRDSGREPKKDPNPQKIILWKLRPPDRQDIPAGQIPKIIYGHVPEGWEQEIPRNGLPPDLVDGYVYYVGVVPARGTGAELCILIKNAEVQPYEDEDDKAVCGRKK